MVVSEYYKRIFQALCTRSMGKVAKAAYEILHMPIVVTDVAYIVRAKYPDEPLGDEQWDANVIGRQIEPRFVQTFVDDDHLAHHDQAGKAILIDWGHYEKTPRLTAVLRSETGHVIGYYSALATGTEVCDWHYEAANVIGEAFTMLMEADVGTRLSRGGMSSPTLYALLDGPLDGEMRVDILRNGFSKKHGPPYLLLCARPVNPHNVPLEAYLGNVLAQYFECAVQTVYDGNLYILVSYVSDDARGSIRGDLFEKGLMRLDLHCGASRRFDKLGEVRLRRWEARKALEVGQKLQTGDVLFHYEDFIAEIVFDILIDCMPENALEHPALANLRRYDEANNTDYMKTLESYYRYDFDKKRTCEALHIHRNTLQYRLARIREQLNIGEEEPFYMLLYFGVEDYRSRVSAEQDACLTERSDDEES